MKSFYCPVSGVAVWYSESILFSHFLILSLPTHGEFGNAGSGPRSGLFDSFLAKAVDLFLMHGAEEVNLYFRI
jgi:hypothetical protein